MVKLKIISDKGEIIIGDHNIQIISIDGLSMVPVGVNMSDLPGLNGSIYNSSSQAGRTLTVVTQLNGDTEKLRQQIYTVLTPGKEVSIHVTSGSINTQANFFVNQIDVDYMAMSQKCSMIFQSESNVWSDETPVWESRPHVVSLFQFPMSMTGPVVLGELTEGDEDIVIYNDSNVTSGLDIEIKVNEPFNRISLYHVNSDSHMTIEESSVAGPTPSPGDSTFVPGDIIEIISQPKRRTITLIKGNTRENIFRMLTSDSQFPGLEPGENVFQYSIEAPTVPSDPDAPSILTGVDLLITYAIGRLGI